MKWTKDDIETAILLIESGKRIEEIAKTLNREFRTVQIKLQKLGYKQNKRQTTENVTCLNCGKSFTSLIRRKRKFCSQSCGAEYNNKKFPKRVNVNKLKNCLRCGIKLNSHQTKFCSRECSSIHYQEENFRKIENGDISFSSTMYKKYLIQKFGN